MVQIKTATYYCHLLVLFEVCVVAYVLRMWYVVEDLHT